VTPGQDGDPVPAEPHPAPAEPYPAPAEAGPPGHARAETYLRLRAEAELRRVQALPRPDPAERGVPAPLRGAARAVLPPGRRAAGILLPLAGQAAQALQPLAENAARALQPLADTAERTLPPLAGNAARTLQPLADTAAKTLQPLASQVIGTVLPTADQAARRLHPLAWEAAGRLQALQHSGGYQLRRWRGRARRVTSTLHGTRVGAAPGCWEAPAGESPGEGVHRLWRLAHALVQAGAIDRSTADSIVADLESALAARSRIDAEMLFMRDVRASRQHQPAGPPAGPYLAVPVGVTTAVPPDSGLAEVHLLTLVVAPDRAALIVVGRRSEQGRRSPFQASWPPLGTDPPKITDDRGNSYLIQEGSGWSDGEGDWEGILDIAPVPPAGTRWLELTLSPGSPSIRADLADARGESQATSGPVPAGRPAERLVDAAALNLLRAAVTGGGADWHDLSDTADLVTALDRAGALEAARGAVGRLVTLAGRLGVDIPPALRAAAPPGELPAAWADVLANRHRRDGPHRAAAAAVVLPELDGMRFVVAGLRSDAAGADLAVLGWGLFGSYLLEESGDRRCCWSARDNRGRWHIADECHISASDLHAGLNLRLVPPLHPEATSLEVTLAGRSGQVTATVPLDWMEPT